MEPQNRSAQIGAFGHFSWTEAGTGRPLLLLHGGAGPRSVAPLADFLAAQGGRSLVPTHPGFGGTLRPDSLSSVRDLAAAYNTLLDTLNLTNVAVIGSSLGGWIAAELALLGSPRVSQLVLLDAVGIEVAGHPVADFFSLSLAEVAQYSYFDPAKFQIDPASLTPEAKAQMARNREALAVYGGTMTDPTLRGRLGAIRVPSLVVWGEADRIADVDYGRAYAQAIPGSRFQVLAKTGHLPQIETPEELLGAVTGFLGSLA